MHTQMLSDWQAAGLPSQILGINSFPVASLPMRSPPEGVRLFFSFTNERTVHVTRASKDLVFGLTVSYLTKAAHSGAGLTKIYNPTLLGKAP